MPQAKQTADQAVAAYLSILFDEAYTLREEQTEFLARRKANREGLRQNVRFMDDEQRTELDELYPPRQSKDEADDAAPAPAPAAA